MLVALAGKARVGKDTIGQFLVREYGFEHYYFARPLKRMLEAMGFPEAQHQTTEEKERVIPELGRSYRYLAQTIGTEWGRNTVHPELWVRLAAIEWKRLREKQARMVITDCRFNNEADWVREAGGIVVHVIGTGRDGMTAEAKAHSSEAGVSFAFDDRMLFNHYEEPTERTLNVLYGTVAALMDRLLT